MGATSRSLSLAFSVFLVSLVVASATDSLQNTRSTKKMLTKVIGIQGLIFCRTGPKTVPIKDALAKVTCAAVDKRGYRTARFSIMSNPTDAKGYFFATLSPSQLVKGWRLSQCKVYLKKSPLASCNVPTDVNNGKTGAKLSSPRFLKTVNLYSVQPFYYTSH